MSKKVLVAGGEGFLGSHVCQLFREKNWQVVSYDNRTKHEIARTGYNVDLARDYNSKFLKSIGVDMVVNDIRHKERLMYEARDCDYIINCAAQPAMTIALEQPAFDADNNIMGVINILEAGRKYGIPVALCSTIHVYGNGINGLLTDGDFKNPDRFVLPVNPCISEDFPLLSGSITPLHVSKYVNELYARAYIESYGSKVFVARLTGIYAQRQIAGMDHGWISNFAIQTLLERPITVFYTDLQVRDILYGSDAAQAFYDWYEHGQDKPGVYNICGGIENITSIRECLQILSRLTGKKQDITITPEPRKGDLWYFVGDYSKAQKAFGWKPTVKPEEGLRKLVAWVEENKELFKGV